MVEQIRQMEEEERNNNRRSSVAGEGDEELTNDQMVKNVEKMLKREVAEEEGFEPPVPCGTHDFESRAFSHSAIPPEFVQDDVFPHSLRKIK